MVFYNHLHELTTTTINSKRIYPLITKKQTELYNMTAKLFYSQSVVRDY